MNNSTVYPLWPNRYRPQGGNTEIKTHLVTNLASSNDPEYTAQTIITTRRVIAKLRKLQSTEKLHDVVNVSPDDVSTEELRAQMLFNKHKSVTRRTRIKPHHFVNDRYDYGQTGSGGNIDPSWHNDGDGPDMMAESMESALYGMEDQMVAHSAHVIDPLQVWKKSQLLSVKYPLQDEFSREDTLNWFEEELGCTCDYIDEFGNAYFGLDRQYIQDYGVDGNPMTHRTAWGE